MSKKDKRYAISNDANDNIVKHDTVEAEGGQPLTRRDFLVKGAAVGLSLPMAKEILTGRTSRLVSFAGARSLPRSRGSSDVISPKGIIVGLDSDIDTLDPISFRSDAAYDVTFNVYEESVSNAVKMVNGISQGIAGSLVPSVASAYSIAPGSTVYKFTVRPGVKFSNGTPVTADTFKYSYLRALEGPGYASLMMGLLTVAHPDQLVVTGPMSFEIHLAKPNPLGTRIVPMPTLTVMDPTLAAQEATKKDPWAANYFRTHMMATGPYVQGTTWESGNQYLLSPNPLYWNRAMVRNAGVLMKYLPDPVDRALLLEQGSIDIALGLPASKLHQLEGAKGVHLINVPSRDWNYLAFNTTMAPFNDPLVRQAIAYAIPYDALVKDAMYGFASPLKGIICSGTPTLNESLWPYTTDYAKAKSLLAAAGKADGFSTTLSVSVSREDFVQVATYIQASLKQVGIQATINQLSDAVFGAKQSAGELPMAINDWYSWVDDPFYQMFWLLDSANTSGTNVAKYSDPTMDSLIKTGFYETDEAKRNLISGEVQARYAAEVPYIGLFSENLSFAMGSDISGLLLEPDAHCRLWGVTKS
jgi:peptide/nickel transport system substrate-binding protein